ncbi:DNA repair protein RecO [candidate division WOR-1 bacterium RIFOXYB2_FULL_48_7]|uniref:DNA repair protein RecO n=1 Tax=candidate division WOR-1 bacterium RIFOXYB2_FULL_48_7 TaxID=1802583 RepID=A0A1F4TR89_UNCSA|nr:MAG: DNA repair protein RecO [candidate division WOR-1 bacterium RIFOXYB2_FULL_48_7]
MPAYKARAISLKTKPFAEADKMVTIFSREYGKLRVLAKSARRVPSRLGGRVETFSYADYFIAKGRSMDIVSQCEILETFQSLREDGSALQTGLYFLKLIDAGTSEGQHNPELFDLLLKALYTLKFKKDPQLVEKRFEIAFMKLEGIYRDGVEPKLCLSEHMGVDLCRW